MRDESIENDASKSQKINFDGHFCPSFEMGIFTPKNITWVFLHLRDNYMGIFCTLALFLSNFYFLYIIPKFQLKKYIIPIKCPITVQFY